MKDTAINVAFIVVILFSLFFFAYKIAYFITDTCHYHGYSAQDSLPNECRQVIH